jgi:hypothetical protein
MQNTNRTIDLTAHTPDLGKYNVDREDRAMGRERERERERQRERDRERETERERESLSVGYR